MERNLVVCCDGTGNIWGGGGTSNVVLLVQALEKTAGQLVFYDPGVGTASELPSIAPWERVKAAARRLWGMAFGDGIYENIVQAYLFLMQHYRPGDRIYVFGFSRGAFTARCVAGMVNLFGVIRSGGEPMLSSMVRLYFSDLDATNSAGKTRKELAEQLRVNFALEGRDARVHFVGVWDTVESVGGLRSRSITSRATVKGKAFDHVRQALALDEARAAYRPRLYDEPDFDTGAQSLQQRWFTGAHCDVGGSYPAHGLSDGALLWILQQARAKGLLVAQAALDAIRPDPLALAHDEPFSRPLWALVGLRRRSLPPGALLDLSVAQRAAAGQAGHSVYRPLWRCGDFWTLLLACAALCLGYWTVLGSCATGWDPNPCAADSRALRTATLIDFGLMLAYVGLFCRLIVHAWRQLYAVVPARHVGLLQAVAQWPLLALIGFDLAENLLTFGWLRACERANPHCERWHQALDLATALKFGALALLLAFLLAGTLTFLLRPRHKA